MSETDIANLFTLSPTGDACIVKEYKLLQSVSPEAVFTDT